MFKFNKSSGLTAQAGQASKLLLVLAAIVLVAVIITFLIIRWATPTPNTSTSSTSSSAAPIYKQNLGNIQFSFESALDKGGVLRASEISSTNNIYYQQQDLKVSNPGAKFIEVTIGAQNQGTINTQKGAWAIGNIVDSQGRNFVPVESYTVAPWIPNPDMCGAVLAPAFDPTPCTRIYEVSKASTGLKITVEGYKNNQASGKMNSTLIDLIVQ